MHKKIVISVILLSFSFTSSFAQNTKSVEIQMQEIMTKHDSLMAQMPKFVKLIGKLEQHFNNSSEDTRYLKAIAELREANSAMMIWMNDFGKRYTKEEMFNKQLLSKEKALLLKEEEIKIIDLEQKINISLAKGESLLNSN